MQAAYNFDCKADDDFCTIQHQISLEIQKMQRMLEDKVVIVTGAGAGVGKTIAIEAARQGARVIINDLGVAEIEGSKLITHKRLNQ